MALYEPIEVGSRSQRTFSFAARVLGALRLDGPLLVGLGLDRALRSHRALQRLGPELEPRHRRRDPRRARRSRDVRVGAGEARVPAASRAVPVPVGCALLVTVDAIGYIGKGAQRWLDLGFIRFQPSELMKLAVPMTCAWWLHDRPLPPISSR